MFIPLHDANALRHIRLQYVTLAIIAANCLIWLVMGTPAIYGQEAVRATVYSYGFIPAVVNGFEVLPSELNALPASVTYISYAFFHGDFMHLAGNMLFIWVFGDNVEDAMGHLRYLFFYVACVIAGAWLHQVADPQSSIPLIGASGGAAGIIGAYILLHPKVKVWVLALGRIPLRIPAAVILSVWIMWQFYEFFTAGDGEISWAAHVGGVIAGAVLILFLRRPGVELFDRDIKTMPAGSADTAQFPVPEPAQENTREPTSIRTEPLAEPSKRRSGSVPATGLPSKRRWGRNSD